VTGRSEQATAHVGLKTRRAAVHMLGGTHARTPLPRGDAAAADLLPEPRRPGRDSPVVTPPSPEPQSPEGRRPVGCVRS
jgi:hypothetical protein